MKLSPVRWALLVALLVGSTQASAVSTLVDPVTRTVRIDLADLPPYEQIRLEGVGAALYWCLCLDSDNPSTSRGTGFTVNGSALELQYEGAPGPSTNHITYTYLPGYDLAGFELVDWILVTETNGQELVLTAERPILVLVPEPATGLLCLLGLLLLPRTRASAHATRTP